MNDAPISPEPIPSTASAQKLDPESFVLRARPIRPIRFKRGVVVGIAAVGSLGLAATTWLALKPGSFAIVSPTEDRNVLGKPSADALGALPSTYGDAPKLGPPLPGDLGRPILERQRAMAIEGNSAGGAPTVDRAASERDRLVAERRSARESGVLFKSSEQTSTATTRTAPSTTSLSAPAAVTPANGIDVARDPNGQQRKTDFVSAQEVGATSNPHALQSAPSPYTLSAGSVVPASLITGLRSDIPGLVIAQVTERVFDSATGRIELIPQGARLIGSYDSVVVFGQRRALVVWQRILMPDGRSLSLDNVPATDPSGYAGLADKVDMHTWTLLKGVAISTLLGVGSSLTFSNESDLVQAIRQSTQQSVSRAGDQITSRNLQVQPTITIRPGASVRLVVHRDLIIDPRKR